MFLEIKQIKKSFGTGDSQVNVLKGIDLEIEKGEFCVLLGPSGSGKSTYAKKFGFRIISSDDVRKDLYGDQECYYNEKIAQFLIIKNNISTASLSKDAIIHLPVYIRQVCYCL